MQFPDIHHRTLSKYNAGRIEEDDSSIGDQISVNLSGGLSHDLINYCGLGVRLDETNRFPGGYVHASPVFNNCSVRSGDLQFIS